MGFPRQEYWTGLPFPSPGDLPDPGIKLTSPALAGGFFTTDPPGKPSYKLGIPKKGVKERCLERGQFQVKRYQTQVLMDTYHRATALNHRIMALV